MVDDSLPMVGSLADAHMDEAAETLLVFLTEGAVFLPAANETVAGRAGRLVAWSNVLPDGRADTRAMHRGIDPHSIVAKIK